MHSYDNKILQTEIKCYLTHLIEYSIMIKMRNRNEEKAKTTLCK